MLQEVRCADLLPPLRFEVQSELIEPCLERFDACEALGFNGPSAQRRMRTYSPVSLSYAVSA